MKKHISNNHIHDNESTKELLRVLIALLVRSKVENPLTLRRQIEVLDDLRLKPTKIAQILGRSTVHINKELTGIRKERTKQK